MDKLTVMENIVKHLDLQYEHDTCHPARTVMPKSFEHNNTTDACGIHCLDSTLCAQS